MATKEKWIDLFEKAVGRPPHALEIEEGQKADFDLKAIKGIDTRRVRSISELLYANV